MGFTQDHLEDGNKPKRTNFDINELKEKRSRSQNSEQRVDNDAEIHVEEKIETKITPPFIGTSSVKEAGESTVLSTTNNSHTTLKERPKREDSDVVMVFRRRARMRMIGDIVRAIGSVVSAIIVVYLFWLWIVPIFWG